MADISIVNAAPPGTVKLIVVGLGGARDSLPFPAAVVSKVKFWEGASGTPPEKAWICQVSKPGTDAVCNMKVSIVTGRPILSKATTEVFDVKFSGPTGPAITGALGSRLASTVAVVEGWACSVAALTLTTCSPPKPFATRAGGPFWML